MRRLVKRIATKHKHVHFCYEAGPTGYGLHRVISALVYSCLVVAPSLIPRKPGDRVKQTAATPSPWASFCGLGN